MFTRHNADRFSKLAFGMGKYKTEDMTGLDVTMVRDYATFMALTPNSQGEGGDEAVKKFYEKVDTALTKFYEKEGGNKTKEQDNDLFWQDYCKTVS